MEGEGAEGYKYWAFISYSHADKQWGDWLHHALETYRVPKRLVGKASRDGVVPRRIFPVFRDREELPGSSNLGDNINSALADSRYLIVICSPRAAVSRWVDEEIKTFKALGREDRVLCLIVDGEPNASSKPDLGLLECFPEAVRFRVTADRQITDEPTEPIAADARPDKDGKANAKLKLLSGVLGVAYDELKQRDRQRRIRRRFQMAALLLLVVALVGGVFFAKEAQRRHEQQRVLAAAEMANALRMLDRGESAQALAWYARALRTDPANELLVSRASSLLTYRTWIVPATPAMRHEGEVTAAEWSPDGSQIATASSDGFVRLWDSATAGVLGEPMAHKRAASLAWSPDGGRLATAGETGAVVWDSATRAPLHSKLSVITPPQIVRFKPDGSALLTAGADATAAIWDADGKRQLTMPHPGPVFVAALTADGARLVTGSLDNAARLWDTATGLPVAEPTKLSGFPLAAEFSPDGARFVTAAESVAQAWNSGTGDLAFQVRHEAGVFAARFSPDGKLLATGSIDKTARLWDATTGAAIGDGLPHPATVKLLAFSGDSRELLTGTTEGSAHLWNVESRRAIGEPFRHHGQLTALSFAPSGDRILTAAKDGTAQVWNVGLRAASPVVLPAAATIVSATFESDGREVQTVSESGATQIWDAASGQLLRTSQESPPPLAVSGDGKRHARLDGNRMSITISDATTAQPVAAPIAASMPVMTAALNRDGSRVCAGLVDSTLLCWDTRNGARLFQPVEHPELIRSVSFSTDGSRIATAAMDRAVRIFDAANGTSLAEPLWHGAAAQHVEFSRDGTRMTVTTHDGKATIWSTAERVPVAEGFQHEKPIIGIARLSADNRRLLTVAGDRAFLWDTVPLGAPAPSWVPELLEAVGGLRIGDNGVPDAVTSRAETGAKIKNQITAGRQNDAFSTWANWLLRASEQRTLSPFSAVPAPPSATPVPPPAVPPVVHSPPPPIEMQRRLLLVGWLEHGSYWLATLRESFAAGSDEAAKAGAIPLESVGKALQIAQQLATAQPDKFESQRDLTQAHLMMASASLFAREPEKALGHARDAVAAVESAVRLRPDDAEARVLHAQALGNLAAMQLYNRQPGEAIVSASRALEIAPNETWIKVNLAHGYLFAGEYEKAEPIYVENKDAELPGFAEKTFRGVMLKTLDELKTFGIEHADVTKARALFSSANDGS